MATSSGVSFTHWVRPSTKWTSVTFCQALIETIWSVLTKTTPSSSPVSFALRSLINAISPLLAMPRGTDNRSITCGARFAVMPNQQVLEHGVDALALPAI